MKAYVYVSLKKSVLDPQGKTIHGALKKMGYRGLDDLRQGKFFEIALDSSISREEAQAEIERIASEVLTNPVIEEYRFTIKEKRGQRTPEFWQCRRPPLFSGQITLSHRELPLCHQIN